MTELNCAIQECSCLEVFLISAKVIFCYFFLGTMSEGKRYISESFLEAERLVIFILILVLNTASVLWMS